MSSSNAQLIYAAAVITMNDAGEIFSPGYLQVRSNLITEVGAGRPTATDGETVHDFADDILLPSFVNTHHHLASSLIQGAAPKHKMAVGTVRADLLVIDGNSPELQPPAGLISQVVMAAKAKCVKHVAMDGKWHLFDYKHQSMNPVEVFASAREVQKRLLESAGIYYGVRGAR